METKYLDALEIGTIVVDESLKVYAWNRWLEINTQVSKQQIIGAYLYDFFPDIERTIITRKIKTALQLKQPTHYKPINLGYFLPVPIKRFIQNDLEFMHQRISISPYKFDEAMVMISVYDTTDIFIAKTRLDNENEKVKRLNSELVQERHIIDQNLMFIKTDLKGRILEISTALAEYYGYSKDELIGKVATVFNPELIPEKLYQELQETLKSGRTWRGEIKNHAKNGHEHWVDAIVSPFFNAENNIVQYTAIYHDIEEKKSFEDLSITDPLTKLHNRVFFDRQMANIFTAKRRSSLVSMMLLDIDYFKLVNDQYGHSSGDLVLSEFAEVLRSSIRQSDLCMRIGGEEFIIVLPDTSLDDAVRVAEKIRQNVQDTHFCDVGSITCSIGVAQRRKNDNGISFYKRIDERLYRAKSSGRNRVCYK